MSAYPDFSMHEPSFGGVPGAAQAVAAGAPVAKPVAAKP
jgi:hypothetical protein